MGRPLKYDGTPEQRHRQAQRDYEERSGRCKIYYSENRTECIQRSVLNHDPVKHREVMKRYRRLQKLKMISRVFSKVIKTREK